MTIGFFPPDLTQNSVATLPAAKTPGVAGYFTDGSTSVTATTLDCDFLNGIVCEFQALSVAGGNPLNKNSPTMVPNINHLISIAGYLPLVGGTLSGALGLGYNYGTSANVPALIVQNGAYSLNVVPNATASAQNITTQAGDTLLWYTQGAVNTGGFVIAPYGSGSTGGFRLDNTGQATFNRPLTASNGFTTSNLNASTGTFSGTVTPSAGVNFGSTSVASTTDLSKHLSLYGSSYGLSITSGRLNIVTPGNSSIVNNVNGNDIATVSSSGFSVTGTGYFSGTLTSNALVTNTVSVTSSTTTNNLSVTGNTAFSVAPTSVTLAPGTSSLQLATTAFVLNQASTLPPGMDGSASAGTSTAYSRQDHVHPTDTSRQAALGFTPVQQGGGTGQGTNKVYLGWDQTNGLPRIQIDTTDIGNVATTTYVINQAATVAPIVDGAASVGTSTKFARQDHVHPTDTSRQSALGFTPVQQGGGNGQGTNKVYLGWDQTNGLPRIQIDTTDQGNLPTTTWVNNNYYTTGYINSNYYNKSGYWVSVWGSSYENVVTHRPDGLIEQIFTTSVYCSGGSGVYLNYVTLPNAFPNGFWATTVCFSGSGFAAGVTLSSWVQNTAQVGVSTWSSGVGSWYTVTITAIGN